MMRFPKLAVLLLLFVVLACANPEVDFQEAKEANTVEAYEAFLERHAADPLAAEALSLLCEVDFAGAVEAHEVEAYRRVAERCPKTDLAVRAEQAIQILEQRIYFVSDRDENQEIYMMRGDGSWQTNLSQNPAADHSPAVSPDGQRIAFISGRDEPDAEGCGNECRTDIYSMAADGSGLTRLTDDGRQEIYLAWSRDGKRLAFLASDEGGLDVYVMNADGSQLTRLTEVGTALHPSWLPDGAVAFLSPMDGGFQFYRVEVDGSGLELLDSGLPKSPQKRGRGMSVMIRADLKFFCHPGNIFYIQAFKDSEDSLGEFPVWSPDGSRVAFHSARSGNREIYAATIDLTSIVRLTERPDDDDVLPVWSPDGSRIAFQSGNAIYVMNADGTGLEQLTDQAVEYSRPAW